MNPPHCAELSEGETETIAHDWLCRAGKRWRPFLTVAAFEAMREAIYEMIENQEGLDNRTRIELRKFTDRFYEVVGDPSRIEREIRNACRG